MYVSIDIETTGLNPQIDQILEVAAVAWDHEDVMKCSTFEAKIYRERIQGTPRAIAMNMALIEEMSLIKIVDGKLWIWPKDLGKAFRKFMDDQGIRKAYPLGKNYGSFDKQFLEKMDNWPSEMFYHRALDVGSLYADKWGIPSLSAIKISVVIPGEPHEALYDARYALQVAMERLPLKNSA